MSYIPSTQIGRREYSNAAIAVAGYLLQEQTRETFTDCVQKAVLRPIGMTASSFTLTSQARSRLAHAIIRTYDGRILDAPTFGLGMAPAGCTSWRNKGSACMKPNGGISISMIGKVILFSIMLLNNLTRVLRGISDQAIEE